MTKTIPYRRPIKVTEIKIIWMAIDIEEKTIQNVQDGPFGVSTFRRLSVKNKCCNIFSFEFLLIKKKTNSYTFMYIYFLSLFTMLAITQTVSVESVTCLVDAM